MTEAGEDDSLMPTYHMNAASDQDLPIGPEGGKPGKSSDSGDAGGAEEIPAEILTRRICDFQLRIEGSPLEIIISTFRQELKSCGIIRLNPQFYLSDEWGVPDGTVAIAIPFYLADENLCRVQKSRGGLVEGTDPEDILRYLRHEMGHVVNYAYRIYATESWTNLFGPMARPYTDEFLAIPFSADFVRNLPGNYAQKHPDDDWAETFAVWMTPGMDWRQLYEDAPKALQKLEFCAATMQELCDRDPEVTLVELDGPVDELSLTVQDFYDAVDLEGMIVPHSLDGDLRGIFSPWLGTDNPPAFPVAMPVEKPRRGSAAGLLRRHKDVLANTTYRWTGVDPQFVLPLISHLAKRADAMGLTYPLDQRDTLLIQFSAFLTTLAMNRVYKGRFFAA